jgi:FKBP-type peptidyl-prolyl cis-trans isomerase
MKQLSILFVGAGVLLSGCEVIEKYTKKTVTITTDDDKVSYSIGQQIGGSMKQRGLAVNVPVLAASIEDALTGVPSRLTADEMRDAMTKMQASMAQKQEQADKGNIEAGAKYLEANKAKTGIKVTASGLQYEVLAEGAGNSPKATDTVKVHYTGTLIDGTKFDSSYDRNEPVEFPVGGVIKGWTEALQLMKPGAKWKLTIPSDLAYGPQGRPSIPANSVLLFDVELLEVKASENKAPAAKAAPKTK